MLKKYAKRNNLKTLKKSFIKTQIGNFILQTKKEYPDYKTEFFLYKHKKLGSKFYHFKKADQNNAFGILLKTLPTDDRGLPHILEHTTLSGSKKYPIRDPFMSMIQRSLNTYLNAWTGPDFTMYPFSTQNKNDFKNLLKVYSDAVFNSRLDKFDFMQEGWRFDIENDKLCYKGVVYNEMKGEYENQGRFIYESVNKEIFKGSEYQYDAGGIPKDIVNLDYDEFLKFYRDYYHPSNCSFISYGDMDIKEQIDFLEKNYLKNFKKNNFNINPKKSSLKGKKNITIKGPPEAVVIKENSDRHVILNFAFDELENSEDFFGLTILSNLMFNYPNSPFYKEFLENGIATGFSDLNGMVGFYKYPYFSIGLKGLKNDEDHLLDVKNKIYNILEELTKNGFDKNLIQSELHLMELNAKLGKSNFGISIFENLVCDLNYENLDKIDLVFNITESLKNVRQKIENENYLENLVDKYFLKNEKKLEVIFEPEENFLKEQNKNETDELLIKEKSLTENEKKKIIENAKRLKERQDQKDDKSVLPKLKIEEISKNIPEIIIESHLVNSIPVNYVKSDTNGITHLRLKFDITGFPDSLVNHLNFFQNFINELGTKEMKYDKFHDLLNLYTNNISVVNKSFMNIEKDFEQNHIFALEICCLDKNLEKMFELLEKFLCSLDFKDHDRFNQLIKIHGSEASETLTEDSLKHAISVSRGSLSEAFHKNNFYKNIKFFCDYSKNYQKEPMKKLYLEDLELNFEVIINKIVKRKRMSFLVHSNFNHESINSKINELINSLEKRYTFFNLDDQELKDQEKFQKKYIKEYYAIPKLTNYCTESFSIPSYLHEDFSKITVMGKLKSEIT